MNKELIGIGICDDESDNLIELAKDIALEKYNTSDTNVVYPILNSLYIVNKIGVLSLIDDLEYDALDVANTLMEGFYNINKSLAKKSNIAKLFSKSCRINSEADKIASEADMTNIIRRLKIIGFNKVSEAPYDVLAALKSVNNTLITVSDYINPYIIHLDDSIFLDEIVEELGGYDEVYSKIEETLKDENYIHNGLNFITTLPYNKLIVTNLDSIKETGELIINSYITDSSYNSCYQTKISFELIKEAFEKYSEIEEESEDDFAEALEENLNYHIAYGNNSEYLNVITVLKTILISVYVYNNQKNHPYIEAIAPRLSVYREVKESTIKASGTVYQLIDRLIQQSKNDITITKDENTDNGDEAYSININI